LKKLILISFIFIAFGSFAQQGLQMEFTEQDSTQMKLQREIEYRQLISGNAFDANLLDEKIELPDFNFMAEYNNRYTLNLGVSPATNYNFVGMSSGMSPMFYSPFYGNATVLSAASYKLGNKFVLGGYSYGTNSIFGAPGLNNGMNNFDNYGSTLILQYKVSKNFKIETQINVQQGRQHPGF